MPPRKKDETQALWEIKDLAMLALQREDPQELRKALEIIRDIVRETGE